MVDYDMIYNRFEELVSEDVKANIKILVQRTAEFPDKGIAKRVAESLEDIHNIRVETLNRALRTLAELYKVKPKTLNSTFSYERYLHQ